jgi:hypothetical protein
LQPTQDSENFLIGTAAAMKKTEYALSEAFQRRRLSEHKEYFWLILGPLVLSLVTIVSCFILCRHSLCVSYSQDERTKEKPQIGMFLHQLQSAMLELRGTLERMLKLEKQQAQFQNERDSLKMTAKLEGKLLINLVSELDLLKMIVNAQDEFLIQLLSDSMLKIETEDEQDIYSHNELDSVKTVEEVEERPAKCQNERDSVRIMERNTNMLDTLLMRWSQRGQWRRQTDALLNFRMRGIQSEIWR